MARFNYKAKDSEGKTVRGKVEAAKIEDAAKLLRERGLVVIQLAPESKLLQDLRKSFTGRVSFDDLTAFTRQFATMIISGIPIADGLNILRSQSKPALRPVISQILADVEAGSSLGDALAKHPNVFSPVYVALVRSGEEGGILDKVLSKLADTMEAQQAFRGRVKGALIYPIVIIVGMAIVITIMMVFVIPKLSQFYAEFNAELPGPTKAIVALSNFTVSFWWLMLLIIGGGVWAILALSKTEEGRRRIDSLKLEMPVFGRLHHQFMLSEFARTLGLLIGAGVPILEGLKVGADVVGNSIIKDKILRISQQVEKGFALSNAVSEYPEVFPPLFYQMIIVGEETGKMDESLLKIAKVYEQEANQSIKNIMSLVEPLIMVVLGIGVAFLVLSIILPIYSLTSQF